MDQQAESMAVARSGIYRLLSVAFSYPDEERCSFLKKGVEEAKGLLAFIPTDEVQGIQEALEAFAISLSSLSPEALQEEYGRVFGHLISQECPPYETQYGNTHVFHQAQRLGDLAGFYRAFGLEVSDQAKERLDHIAVELEFMAFLASKEAYALEHQGEEAAAICREAERAFLEGHLGRFAPLFTRLLRRKAEEGYYQALAILLDRFLASEVKRFQARPSVFQEGALVPVDFEPEGSSFSGEAVDTGVSHFIGEGLR